MAINFAQPSATAWSVTAPSQLLKTVVPSLFPQLKALTLSGVSTPM